MGPYLPCTAVSSFIKWGWRFHSGFTPSYLTDVLWGLMKLCIQCFQFLEKNYLWTFRVLYRYISDLSFLLTVILVCCFYLLCKTTVNVTATSDGYQSSELPSRAPDWCWVSCFGDHRGCLPSSWKGGPGHRSHRPASGSRLACHTWMPQHFQKKASDFHTPRSRRSRLWSDVICPSSCLQGCMVRSYASWKWILWLVQMLICTSIHLHCL